MWTTIYGRNVHRGGIHPNPFREIEGLGVKEIDISPLLL